MLKALELVGFKSFADKTRFEFDAGMTAIVGPNGSGKSNVVDALRWVLGEQSAKSLRGKEMTDVIFSGSGARRPLGLAEVSLCFDNRKNLLAIESPEVVLTRRVYADAAGEYLINGQPARLRDIKELFLGTGAGVGAYSIIEQGKVEMMLQSSTKDRRHIFDEAAGISRFKARKIECLRRLDRVDQNLLRVRDIHEEVEKQLRALRHQAGRARKFKEYSDRLRELRLAFGLSDYHRLSQDLLGFESRRDEVTAKVAATEIELADFETAERTLEDRLADREEALRRHETWQARLREQISSLEAELAADSQRAAELASETADNYDRCGAERDRLRRLARDEREATQALLEAEQEVQSRLAEAEAAAAFLHEAQATLDARRTQAQELRRQCSEKVRALTRRENEQSALESQLSLLWPQAQRLVERQQEHLARWRETQRELMTLIRQEQIVKQALRRSQDDAGGLHGEHKQLLESRSRLQQDLANLRGERTAIAGRREVLTNLRERHEGLQGGVRHALSLVAEGQAPWDRVQGVLAEKVQVSSEHADLVELALGARAQALLVNAADDISTELIDAAHALPGRVQFLAIHAEDADHMVIVADDMPAPALAGLIECDGTVRPLVDRLLGDTYLVDNFETAMNLARPGAETRFITRAGDVIEADGAVSAGPHRVTAGILSRAAEIRDLDAAALELDQAIARTESQAIELERGLGVLERQLSAGAVRASTLAEQCRHFEALKTQAKRNAVRLEQDRQTAQQESSRIAREIADIDAQCRSLSSSLATEYDEIKAMTDEAGAAEEAAANLMARVDEVRAAFHAAELEAAKTEERRRARSARRDQVGLDLSERQRVLAELEARLDTAIKKRTEIERRRLAAASALADLYHEREAGAGDPVSPAAVAELRDQRRALADQLRARRETIASGRDALHQAELRATEIRLQRDGLAARIFEDYGVQLTELTTQPRSDQALAGPMADAQREEIDLLRERIAKLGSVNLHAIEELDQLEQRTESLSHQLEDLAAAKRHLEEVINRINEESRRLFLDTFESVREHFQEFFRHLFGGGKADILLEDETDVLETGIEIIARPPGKEPRGISLLSGGEKTMTAVALLMALFRSRPSPFCVLDEVDAALDEANIGRFVTSLRDFLKETQFLVITHSKTTMAACDVLHGVTQRESGVSLRVSVRLEDVTDDGNLLENRGHDESY